MKRLVIALSILSAMVCTAISSGYSDQSSRLAGNHPLEVEHRPALGNLEAGRPLAMEMRLKLRNEKQLDQLLEQLQDPHSSNYRKFLKRGEFDRGFGPLQSDVDAVADWLRGEGFTATPTSSSVEFTGTVAQAERTFAVQILKLSATEYSNMEDPAVPARFASLVGSIEGLNNLTHFEPVAKVSPDAKKLHAIASRSHKMTRAEALREVAGVSALASSPDSDINGLSYGDMDMRNTYDVPSDFTIGGGDCIAIVGVSDYLDGALAAFTNQFSDLPAFNITRVNVGTNPGRTQDSSEAEAELDLEWSHVMAPGAPTHFYLGSNLQTDITQAVNDDLCKVISISFEFCGNTSTFYTSTLDGLFKKAAGQGQSVFVSTGDHGAAGSVVSGGRCVAGSSQNVSEMAADPFVTAVGGTQILSPNYNGSGIAQSYATETAWNDAENGGQGGSGAGGGGASMYFTTKPSYQTGPGVPNDGHRDIPDVAMLSGAPRVFYGDDNNGTGFLNCCEGGTSLAAPLWAGMTKDIEAQIGALGSFNPTIYTLANQQYGASATPDGFHDITSGDNSFNGVTGFTAGTAYDEATGWGSVDFQVFSTAVMNNPLPTATATATATPTATPTTTPTPTPTTMMLGVPPQISFGNLDASSSSKARKASFANKGVVDAIVGTVSVPPPFAIAAGSDHCSGQTVLPKKSCIVMVLFSPTAPVPASGAISVPYNGAAPATVNLSGNGTMVAMKGPASVAFAPVAVGSTGAPKPIAITNESKTATVQMGTADPGGSFMIASDACSNQPIKPRGKCVIKLEFAPTSQSTTSGTLNIGFTYGSNNGSVPTISLEGRIK